MLKTALKHHAINQFSAQTFDKPRHRARKPEIVPTEEELEAYLNEATQFTKGLRAELDVPHGNVVVVVIVVFMFHLFNPLPDMPILGPFNSTAKKDMMAKIYKNRDTVICLSRKHCGKRKNCSLQAISPFPTMFSKAVCC